MPPEDEYEFTFKFVGRGESVEDALRDAINSIQTAIAQEALEPTNIARLD